MYLYPHFVGLAPEARDISSAVAVATLTVLALWALNKPSSIKEGPLTLTSLALYSLGYPTTQSMLRRASDTQGGNLMKTLSTNVSRRSFLTGTTAAGALAALGLAGCAPQAASVNSLRSFAVSTSAPAALVYLVLMAPNQWRVRWMEPVFSHRGKSSPSFNKGKRAIWY